MKVDITDFGSGFPQILFLLLGTYCSTLDFRYEMRGFGRHVISRPGVLFRVAVALSRAPI